MRITVIIPFCNQIELLEANLRQLASTIAEPDTNIVLIDNNSDLLEDHKLDGKKWLQIINEGTFVNTYKSPPGFDENKFFIDYQSENRGNYPLFFEYRAVGRGNEIFGDILAYFHSDFVIWEKGWDTRVKNEFEKNEKLGLIGFIGSDEIDSLGGRGLGTASNFMGRTLLKLKNNWGSPEGGHAQQLEMMWTGSAAEVHGKRITGSMKAAVVDGCSMIFRKSVLDQIPERENFPPHHFYDRLFCCETIERGYEVEVLGIECDHISGQTANTQNKWAMTAKIWCDRHGVKYNEAESMDQVVYREAERQWLEEYRAKGMVPLKV